MPETGPRPFRFKVLWLLLAASVVMALPALQGEILSYLRAHQGNVVTRDEFLLEVWKYPTASVETRTVDNTLAALRKKIETNPADPQIIKTVRGKGYRWGA